MGSALAILGFLKQHWKFAVIGVLIAILAFQRADLRHKDKVIAGDKAALALEQQGRAQDRLAYTNAQTAAHLLAEQQKVAAEARYAQFKKDSDNALQAQSADDRARLAEWMRRASGTAQGGTGQPNMPGTSGTAGQPQGAGATPALDGILAICTENTRRLANAVEWGAKVEPAK